MHPQTLVSNLGWFQTFFQAKHFSVILALSFSLILTACGGGGSSVIENDLVDPGSDGVAPVLVSVSILEQQERDSSPDGVAKLGQSVKVDFTASEALMTPVVTINGVAATLEGKIGDWSASRAMTADDVDGYLTFNISFTDASGEVGVDVSETTDGSRVQYCTDGCAAPVEDTVVGRWKLSNEVGSAGVGPAPGDVTWWSLGEGDLIARACFMDDVYVFGADGSFSLELGDETWLETWQSDAEACGTPVAPHDGSGTYSYTYVAGETITLNGAGAYIGIAKAGNTYAYETNGVPTSIVYTVEGMNAAETAMTIAVQVTKDDGNIDYWTYQLVKEGDGASGEPVTPVANELGTGSDTTLNVGEVINFNSTVANYGLEDFGGNSSAIVQDPTDATNTVVSITKGAETWAGTTIASGSVIYPLTATHTVMTVRVWSPEAGITVRLKLEESGDDTATIETDAVTTVASAWEVLTFDFSNPATNDGNPTNPLDVTKVFDKLSIFMNYGVAGSAQTYYFDDVTFVGAAAVVAATVTAADLVGDWKLAPVAGALAVGESADNLGWWSSDEATVTERACLFDDVYTFGSDGSFSQAMGTETWVEAWQGTDPEGCAAPVAPHDGSYTGGTYSVADSKVTVNGLGAHLGLPKVTGSGEISDPANAVSTITYNVTELSADGNNMTVQIQYNGAETWQFKFAKAK